MRSRIGEALSRHGDLLFLVALVILVIALSYSTLYAFILPYAVGGSSAYAHGLAAAIDAIWIYSLFFLARGRATTRNAVIIARTLLYGALSVSLISAAFFGFTTLGFVAAILYVLPGLGILGIEGLITSTYIGAPAVTVTKSFGTPTGKAPVATDLVSVVNEIVDEVKTGNRRPGWGAVAKRFGLNQSQSRRVVSLVKEATGEAA